jgi:hypothetical protein
MRKQKNRIYTLDDVRKWREFKKDELDLEMLKFHAEKEHLKSTIKKDITKFLFYESMILVGEKLLSYFLKTTFSSSKKKKK